MTEARPRHLSTAEAAKAAGVSARALRLYEQRGLLKPQRTAAGWRAYGPQALARLHQVLALKRLGLPLSAIGELLNGRLATLESVLALQEQALEARRAEAERALALIRRARARLSAGEALSADDLTTLSRETTMSMNEDEMKAVFQPLIAKHYSPESLAKLAAKPYDQAEATRAWEQLKSDAMAAMAKGDPTTPEAIDVARRWSDLVSQFTGGDPEIAKSLEGVWKDAMANPAFAARMPQGPNLMAFIQRAAEAGKGGRAG